MMHNQAQKKRINPGGDIIHHDTESAMQPFKLPDRWRLDDVEDTEERQRENRVADVWMHKQQCDQLTGNFIDHNISGVLPPALFLDNPRRLNPDQCHNNRSD